MFEPARAGDRFVRESSAVGICLTAGSDQDTSHRPGEHGRPAHGDGAAIARYAPKPSTVPLATSSRSTIIPNVQIAVVEDDQLVRDFVVDAFEFSINRKIHTFTSGFAAWQVIQSSQPIHIVFADIHVPDMDGLELTARIKTERPEIVCILASGNPADEGSATQAGADAFLLKPYGVNDLFALIKTFVAADGDKPERSLPGNGH